MIQKQDEIISGRQTENVRRCIYCGSEAELVWVHGHGQCATCGINVEECCRGENCSTARNDLP